MLSIAREAERAPTLLRDAPHARPVRRLDEVKAAKQAILRYRFEDHPAEEELAPSEGEAIEAQKGA